MRVALGEVAREDQIDRRLQRRVADVVRLRVVAPRAQLRDRGLVRFNMKQFKSALADLESYLNNTAEAPDRSAILKLSKSIARTIEKKG